MRDMSKLQYANPPAPPQGPVTQADLHEMDVKNRAAMEHDFGNLISEMERITPELQPGYSDDPEINAIMNEKVGALYSDAEAAALGGGVGANLSGDLVRPLDDDDPAPAPSRLPPGADPSHPYPVDPAMTGHDMRFYEAAEAGEAPPARQPAQAAREPLLTADAEPVAESRQAQADVSMGRIGISFVKGRRRTFYDVVDGMTGNVLHKGVMLYESAAGLARQYATRGSEKRVKTILGLDRSYAEALKRYSLIGRQLDESLLSTSKKAKMQVDRGKEKLKMEHVRDRIRSLI